MKPRLRLALPLAAVALSALALGCPSAYDRTFERESQRLEEERRAEEARERAALEEARRFAAVVYFASGSSVIDEGGFRELDWFAEKMQPFPRAVIEVRGFADTTGNPERNQQLSNQRAENVARYLATRGIESSRIQTMGFASEFPAETNETSHGRSRNRRVEVTVR